MTDKQPDALRLADWLERRTMVMLEDKQAAAELRRLHEVNAELVEAFKKTREALQFANDSPSGGIDGTIWMPHQPETLFDFIDAAIAKATGENND